MTKLEWIRKVITGEAQLPAAGITLGFRMIEAEEGSTTMQMDFQESLTNRSGSMQGGVLAALMDASMGSSLSTVSEENEDHATLEFKVSFMRPATAALSPFTAVGLVLYRGRSIAHTTSEVKGSDGTLLAKATGSWMIKRS